MIFKRLKLFVFAILISIHGFCGEGMWLPLFLKSLNEKEMKSMGMKISAEDIYSINKGSLKDAIVLFGGGCTSEIISDQGLMLTNHHCGYGYIQSYTTIENNYLRDGFWARSKSEELKCSGLTATLIVRMEDVTLKVLDGVDVKWNENRRRNKVDENIEKIKLQIPKEADQDLLIRSFYNGNQYFLFVTEVFKDVRLVGAPPESIGKFGADTDNWVWPRHTGDFSLFRIYANKSNRPAEYSKDNQPYKPKHFLPISLSGVNEGDFTMVFGFPGRTSEYLIAEAIRQQVEVLNPVRISLRDKTLKILDKHMRSNEQSKIQYASKYAGIANAWKKWIGENLGMKITNGLNKKQKADAEFQKRVNSNPLYTEYKNLIPDLENQYIRLEPFTKSREYYSETFSRNTDLINYYQLVKRLIDIYEGRGEATFKIKRDEVLKNVDGYFKDFDSEIDQEVFSALLEEFSKEMNPAFVFQYLKDELRKVNSDYKAFAKNLYTSSKLMNKDSFSNIFKLEYPQWLTKIREDKLFTFYEEMNYYLANDINKICSEYEDVILDLRRKHMAALMVVLPEKKYYPDANSTLRVTYGKVEGYKPRDGVHYLSRTTLDGVMEKYIPGDYEFDVPKKLQTLINNKDYGIYGENGKMPLAFIGSNHTTGGNSGSPAIDAHGNLIGLNFDRVWEGTMSDINYDPSICRNIMVDARYILFIIDKFAGAPWIVQEMKLVYPKKRKK
ncbi:MAG: S46 family peptidase [Saprospiraceae bacterium]|nr:S46 family peptidase [Saprospiraceae bacterium]